MIAPCLFLRRLGVDDLAALPPEPSRLEIIRFVAERYGLTVADLQSLNTERRVAWPRQEAMALMYAQNRWSRGEIGLVLNRTSWTVTHGVAAYHRRLADLSTSWLKVVDGTRRPAFCASQTTANHGTVAA